MGQFAVLVIQIFWYILRGIFFAFRSPIWLGRGIYSKWAKLRRGEPCEQPVQCLNILRRHKMDLVHQPSDISNFLFVHDSWVDEDYVLDDTVTLYAVTKQEAIFVQSPANVNVKSIKSGTFMKVAQFENAEKVLIMPIRVFHHLAEQIGDPKSKIVFTCQTATSGTAFLSHVLEDTEKCIVLSEPDALNSLATLDKKIPTVEYGQIATNAVRVLCKPSQRMPDVVCTIIHLSTPTMQYVPYLNMVFPTSKNIFVYRDGLPVCMAQSNLSSSCLVWANAMDLYRQFRENDIGIVAVKYDDLVGNTLHAVRKIVEYCQVPFEVPEQEADGWNYKAFKSESQISNDRLEKYHSEKYTAEVKAKCDAICDRLNVPKLDEECFLDGTISNDGFREVLLDTKMTNPPFLRMAAAAVEGQDDGKLPVQTQLRYPSDFIIDLTKATDAVYSKAGDTEERVEVVVDDTVVDRVTINPMPERAVGGDELADKKSEVQETGQKSGIANEGFVSSDEIEEAKGETVSEDGKSVEKDETAVEDEKSGSFQNLASRFFTFSRTKSVTEKPATGGKDLDDIPEEDEGKMVSKSTEETENQLAMDDKGEKDMNVNDAPEVEILDVFASDKVTNENMSETNDTVVAVNNSVGDKVFDGESQPNVADTNDDKLIVGEKPVGVESSSVALKTPAEDDSDKGLNDYVNEAATLPRDHNKIVEDKVEEVSPVSAVEGSESFIVTDIEDMQQKSVGGEEDATENLTGLQKVQKMFLSLTRGIRSSVEVREKAYTDLEEEEDTKKKTEVTEEIKNDAEADTKTLIENEDGQEKPVIVVIEPDSLSNSSDPVEIHIKK